MKAEVPILLMYGDKPQATTYSALESGLKPISVPPADDADSEGWSPSQERRKSIAGRISILTWGVRSIIFLIIVWIYLFD
jgi:hypothetical protein